MQHEQQTQHRVQQQQEGAKQQPRQPLASLLLAWSAIGWFSRHTSSGRCGAAWQIPGTQAYACASSSNDTGSSSTGVGGRSEGAAGGSSAHGSCVEAGGADGAAGIPSVALMRIPIQLANYARDCEDYALMREVRVCLQHITFSNILGSSRGR